MKSNVGHSEAASGITSIIKATLMLESSEFYPTHGLANINPKIKLDEWNVRLVTDKMDWPGTSAGHPRYLGINSVSQADCSRTFVVTDEFFAGSGT